MRNHRRTATALAVAVGAALVLSACTGTDSVARDSAVTVATSDSFFSYNDATQYGDFPGNTAIVEATKSSFNYYNAGAELVRDTSFGSYRLISTHPLVVKYTIRDGVEWSDGTRVDAADLLLAWAANSGALNTPGFDPGEHIDNATGKFTPDFPRDVVYFDGATSSGLHQVTRTPTIGDDGRSITLAYDRYFADWNLVLEVGAPAHVVARHALGIKDAAGAKAALVGAIQHKNARDLAAISRFWNSGFNLEAMPSSRDLLVGSGPYTITDFVADDHLTLKANPRYSGDHKPVIETVTVRFIADPLSRMQALRDGEVDVVADSADAAKEVGAIPGANMVEGLAGDFEHLDLQQARSKNGSFDNPLVRAAFLKVVPRRQILGHAGSGVRKDTVPRSSQLFLPSSPHYRQAVAENGSTKYADVDVAGAKKLLAEAGVARPAVCILFDSSNPRRRTEFSLIKTSAARAGFLVTACSTPDWANLLGAPGAYDAALFAWSESNASTSGSQAVFGTAGARNYTFYSSAEVDSLLRDLAAAADPGRQTELRRRIDRELWKDAYGVPLYQFPQVAASNSRVSGVAPSALAAGILWNVWEWKSSKPR